MKNTYITTFAATYNCSAYGASTYNSAGVCGVSTTTTTGANGLAGTGSPVAVEAGIGLALVVLGVSLFALLRRRVPSTK